MPAPRQVYICRPHSVWMAPLTHFRVTYQKGYDRSRLLKASFSDLPQFAWRIETVGEEVLLLVLHLQLNLRSCARGRERKEILIDITYAANIANFEFKNLKHGMENFLKKKKNRITIWSSNSTSGHIWICTQKNWKQRLKQIFIPPGSLQYYSQQLKSKNNPSDHQTMLYPYNRALFCLLKEGNWDIHQNMDEFWGHSVK